MKRLSSEDLRELKLLKHYRIIRKWACKICDLKDADLELLIYLDSLDFFTKDDFKKGTYSRNRTTQKYNIYKVSVKCKQLISRMYRIMLGEEDMPTKKLDKNNRYIYKVTAQAVRFANKDKER